MKTDLTDFLTSASAEGETVLNSLDQTISSLDEKLNHSKVDDGNNVSIDANDYYVNYEHDYEESPEEEAVRLAGLEETYTEPLLTNPVDCSDLKEVSYETQDTSYESYETEEDDDEETFERHQVEQFLNTFDIQSYSIDISQLLHPLVPNLSPADGEAQCQTETIPESNLTTLQIQYQALVPQHISHEEFFTRYYFRCNPSLIAERNEYSRMLREQQQQLDMRALNEAAAQITKSAANLFRNVSGAVGAVGDSIGEATRELRLHQSSGRPPFVMTAMEDDDDEYIEGEGDAIDAEEEASLGWESESEEEVTIDCDEDDSIHDEVAFVEGISTPHTPLNLESIDVVKLRRTLMHVESERNNMMQMVEERNEEIVRLKCVLEQKSQTDSSKDETLHKLRNEAKCLRTAVELRLAEATIRELETSVEALKNAKDSSALEHSIEKESTKQKALQSKLDEYKDKMEQLERQKQEADARISQLLLEKPHHST